MMLDYSQEQSSLPFPFWVKLVEMPFGGKRIFGEMSFKGNVLFEEMSQSRSKTAPLTSQPAEDPKETMPA